MISAARSGHDKRGSAGPIFRAMTAAPMGAIVLIVPPDCVSKLRLFLAGDLARAAMLHALIDGRALTASELARVADVTPQTASEHLARMAAASLVQVDLAASVYGPFSFPGPADARYVRVSVTQLPSLSMPTSIGASGGEKDTALSIKLVNIRSRRTSSPITVAIFRRGRAKAMLTSLSLPRSSRA